MRSWWVFHHHPDDEVVPWLLLLERKSRCSRSLLVLTLECDGGLFALATLTPSSPSYSLLTTGLNKHCSTLPPPRPSLQKTCVTWRLISITQSVLISAAATVATIYFLNIRKWRYDWKWLHYYGLHILCTLCNACTWCLQWEYGYFMYGINVKSWQLE